MVSRGEVPNLDRRISIILTTTQTVITPPEVLTFTFYNFRFGLLAGEYSFSGPSAFNTLGFRAAAGDTLPLKGAYPAQGMITVDVGGIATTYAYDRVSDSDNYGTPQPGQYISFRFPDPEDLDTTEDVGLRIAEGGSMEVNMTGPVPLWAARGVLSPTDQIEVSSTARLNINLARYTVRFDSRIAVAQTLTDEEGNDRTILGRQPIGRRKYLDLLVERIA